MKLLAETFHEMHDPNWFLPSPPRHHSGSSLSGIEGSTLLGALSVVDRSRTVMNTGGS